MHRTVDRSFRKSKYWKYTRYPYCFSYLTVLTLLSQAIDNSSISSQVWHNGIMLGQQSLQECNVPSVMFRSVHITYVQVHQNKYKGNKHMYCFTVNLRTVLIFAVVITGDEWFFLLQPGLGFCNISKILMGLKRVIQMTFTYCCLVLKV